VTRRVLAAALLACAVGLAAAARLAAGGGDGGAATDATGSATRLGPRDGELVSEYVARTRAALAGRHDREPTYALVATDRYLTPAQVPGALPGAPVVRALVRVPLPRVQTRLFEIPARTSADITGGMGAAAGQLDDEVRSGRAGDAVAVAVARAQAERLRQGCACVLGAVVRATPDALARLSRAPAVRAVEPAPPGEPLARLAFAPLLPEQTHRVAPPPDDGAGALVSQRPTAGATGRAGGAP
jgi:hypothetical protein